MADLLERTATQVRRGDGPVHRMVKAEQDRTGRLYTTICGDVLAGAAGAMLTTVGATCPTCRLFGRMATESAP